MIANGIRQGNKVCLKYLIQFITLLYLERLNDALLQYAYVYEFYGNTFGGLRKDDNIASLHQL